MPEEKYPLEVESVGSDTYIVMSKGHHDLTEFMTEAVKQYPGWFLGGAEHVWCKTVPSKGQSWFHFVAPSTRGAWPATYCWEYAGDYEEWMKREVTP